MSAEPVLSISYIIFVLLMITCYCHTQEERTSCPEILNYIKQNLPLKGVLKYSSGFFYVDLTDDYIHKLSPFIQKEGFVSPPYFGTYDAVGAHITVFYPDEVLKFGVEKIDECGEFIEFTPIKCQVVHPPTWEEIDEVYFIVVEAPELNRIRDKYGLHNREYDFHITIGVKLK